MQNLACALWGDRGPKLAQYLTSGTKVAVSGDIDVRAYAAKDGSPKAEMTCNVQRLTLQGGGDRRTSEDVAKTDPPAGDKPKKDGGGNVVRDKVSVIGKIPRSLPTFHAPKADWKRVRELSGSALAIAISWSVNKSLLWAIVHGIFSWFYVLYFAFTRD